MFTSAADAIASYVVAMRKKKGWNQRQLAEALGREQNYVARIETGQRRVDLVEWVIICRAFDVNPGKETARLIKEIVPLVRPPRRRTDPAKS